MSEKTISIVICDDDPNILERLSTLCHNILSEQYCLHIWTTTDPYALLSHKGAFDIVLLDMQFPNQYGVSIAQELLQKNSCCQIIFISGFLTSVSPAYDVPHLAMILKDQLDKYLPHFLLRAVSIVDEFRDSTLQITVKKEQISLPLKKISVIERIGHWTYFHMIDESQSVPLSDKLRTREKLSDILDRMRNPEFCRCHISYAVNLQNVQSLQKHDFEMRIGNGETILIPISRFYEVNCRNAFFQHLSSSASHVTL